MKKTSFFPTVLFLITVLGSAAPVWSRMAWSQTLSDADMIDYLAQSLCLDPTGKPSGALPIDEDCRQSRPQRSEDAAPWRKHDWPNSLAAAETVQGYQASDSVVQRRGARTLVVQTFDFGTGGRVFGRFDGGLGKGGDGGQVLMLVDGWSTAAMTEDGGGGIQWFISEACRSPFISDRRFLGWLMFRNEVGSDSWKSIVARLNITASPESCPPQFNAAFTRYRLGRIAFPFRIVDADSRVTTATRSLDVVVSEHYGGTDIGSADHLERFFFARKLGLVRWERWSNRRVSRQPGDVETAAQLARTARCPKLGPKLERPGPGGHGLETQGPETYGQPGRDWLLVDCRTWTALVRQTVPWSVDSYGWTVLERFDRLGP